MFIRFAQHKGEKDLTKQAWIKRIVISAMITVMVIVSVICFCLVMFQRYSLPAEHNTTITAGTVNEVYFTAPKDEVVIELTNGERLQLVYPSIKSELFSAIGYNIEELADLLEGKQIQYRRMNDLPWVVQINVDDQTIDNHELTAQQISVSRSGLVIVGLIVFVLAVSSEATYLKTQYDRYRNAERKRFKKARREGRKRKK